MGFWVGWHDTASGFVGMIPYMVFGFVGTIPYLAQKSSRFHDLTTSAGIKGVRIPLFVQFDAMPRPLLQDK